MGSEAVETGSDGEERGVRLLTLFDALVRREPALSPKEGLRGAVAMGIARDGGEEVWWRAAFGDGSAETSFPTGRTQADAALLLSTEAAEAVLAGEGLPPSGAGVSVDGDRSLLTAFFSRYTANKSWLDLRMGSA